MNPKKISTAMRRQGCALIATLALSLSAFAQDNQNAESSSTTTETSRIESNTEMKAGAERYDTGETDRTPSSETATETTQNTSDMSPKDVCNKIVEITKNTAASNSTQMDQFVWRGRDKTSKNSPRMSKDWIKQDVSKADCGSETVAGNHAFVVAKSSDKERLLPFVKIDNKWKLDSHAYHALYRMDSRQPASK